MWQKRRLRYASVLSELSELDSPVTSADPRRPSSISLNDPTFSSLSSEPSIPHAMIFESPGPVARLGV